MVKIIAVSAPDKQDRKDYVGEKAHTYQVKVHITEKIGSQIMAYNKKIAIEDTFIQLDLSKEDYCINPLGFRVLAYKVDDQVVK